MQLNPAEISELIKSRIEGLGASVDIKNQGTVVSVTCLLYTSDAADE